MGKIVWQSFLASCAGGFLSLDRTAALQIMISRPIVTAPLIGAVLGDVVTGLFIGAVLELLWIGELPMGGYIPPHEVMMTVLITAISLIGKDALNGTGLNILWISHANVFFVLGLTVLLVFPMDIICKRIDKTARGFNRRFFDAACAGLDKGVMTGLTRNNLKGLVAFFILNFSALFVLTIIGILLVYLLFPVLPGAVISSLPLVFCSMVIVGSSSAYSTVYSKRSLPVFLVSTFFVIIVFFLISIW